MKLAVLLLFMAVQVAAQKLSPAEATDAKDQLLRVIPQKTWKSIRYVGARTIENYNHYSFPTKTDLFKQHIEAGQEKARRKFTWSLTQSDETSFYYLTIMDHLSKEVVIYYFDRRRSAVPTGRLLFRRRLESGHKEGLYLHDP